MTPTLLRSVLAVLLAVVARAQHAVVATTPDLGSIAAAIGGDCVTVQSLARGPQDPHFVEPRPSVLQALRRAEALVEVGRELEVGWLGPLVDGARNPAVRGGQPGRIDASSAVRALGVPPAGTDRSAGDVHAQGNPHFLLDPLCGLQVAALLRDRFAALWPDAAPKFAANFARFRERLAVAMVGEVVARRYEHDAERLAVAFRRGTLADVLREHGDLEQLAGWFAALLPLRGSRIVTDHDLWPYFAEACGLEVVATLEPKPGVAPTTAHLQTVIARMQQQSVRAILVAPYLAREHAELVAVATGARIAQMAHQVGALPGTDDYCACVGHDVTAVVEALAAKTPR